jgi:hypothetical protein
MGGSLPAGGTLLDAGPCEQSLRKTIRAGETYPLPRDMTRDDALTLLETALGHTFADRTHLEASLDEERASLFTILADDFGDTAPEGHIHECHLLALLARLGVQLDRARLGDARGGLDTGRSGHRIHEPRAGRST